MTPSITENRQRKRNHPPRRLFADARSTFHRQNAPFRRQFLSGGNFTQENSRSSLVHLAASAPRERVIGFHPDFTERVSLREIDADAPRVIHHPRRHVHQVLDYCPYSAPRELHGEVISILESLEPSIGFPHLTQFILLSSHVKPHCIHVFMKVYFLHIELDFTL
jgi:hypothetical protein